MASELSARVLANTLMDCFGLWTGKHLLLKPLFFTFYNTLRCNFSCSYCTFANSTENNRSFPELTTPETMKLLRLIRPECPNIYFTGGEPLLRHDIVDVLRFCRAIGFKSISINTNMSLIHRRAAVLDHITNLVASLDTLDERQGGEICGTSASVVKQVRNNIEACARLQKQKKFRMTVNCVVTPQTVSRAREVMEFCSARDIRFAIAPAELDGGRIHGGLSENAAYRKLIADVIRAQADGKPVFGSRKYLETISGFKPFTCFPTLSPHIYPNGDAFYPCEPLQKVGGNILQAGSWRQVLIQGARRWGELPFCRDRCFKACYIEPPILLKNPLGVVKEASRVGACRP